MIEHMALISDFGFQIQIFWVFFDYVDFNSADEKGYLVKLLQREEFPERFLQSLYTQFLPIKEFQLVCIASGRRILLLYLHYNFA